MLKYLILGAEGMILTTIIAGLLYAWISGRYGNTGKYILHGFALCGMIAAIVMSYMKNTTSLVHTGTWNVRIFTVALAAALLLLVFGLIGMKKRSVFLDRLVCVMAGIYLAALLFYALPDIYAAPFNFSLGGAGVFSSAFFTRLVGLLLGVFLSILAGIATARIGSRSPRGLLTGVLVAAVLVNTVHQFGKIASVLYTRRVISGTTVFNFVKWSANNEDLFIYGVMAAAAVLPIVMWVRSFHVNEPYENPAQHRKIRAKWRSIRRWGSTALICSILGIVILSPVKAYANRPVELSPVEESILDGDNVYVPLEQVEDGHLHRFAYTTPDDITVRFIVIKKPNSSSYGVGLDACDICGETGYFERNGQIVCKLCDVVMNINTIGFKGGCNPIVIDYSVGDGYICVPTSTLIEHQDEFK
ncbi:MAG: DUF2318 domain-containing protein [Blautia sp.]|nr:DUF2318 domain-containing protein [Blautia sp.]